MPENLEPGGFGIFREDRDFDFGLKGIDGFAAGPTLLGV